MRATLRTIAFLLLAFLMAVAGAGVAPEDITEVTLVFPNGRQEMRLVADKAQATTVRGMHARLLEVMKADGDPLAAKLPKDPLA